MGLDDDGVEYKTVRLGVVFCILIVISTCIDDFKNANMYSEVLYSNIVINQRA